MATNTIKMTIQFRRDTAANWEQYKHLAPAEGEPCFEIDTGIFKIGDGKTPYGDLKAIGGVSVSADGKSIVLENGVFKLAGFDATKVGAHPRVSEDGSLEWVMAPTVETVTALQDAVKTLQNNVTGLSTNVGTLQSEVADLRAIVGASETGSVTLLTRVNELEKEIDTIMHGLTPDDGKIDSLIELINYVDTHGKKADKMVSDINTLYELVGSDPVADQIISAVEASEKKSAALYEHVKYEVTDTPVGTLVDYRDKEIRIMVPAGAEFTKQNVGAGGDANSYYMTFKTYAPNDKVVGYREHLGNQVDAEILTDLNVDAYGRRYQPTWLALAKYDEITGSWNYYGASSTVNKYTGWDYQIDWYDANGVVIASDKIRINLSNETCHTAIEPYYMSNIVKGVSVNGTLLDMVDGKVDITIPEFKSSDEIEVAEDGTLRIKAISFDKVVQAEDEEIVLSGGGAAG